MKKEKGDEKSTKLPCCRLYAPSPQLSDISSLAIAVSSSRDTFLIQ